MLCENLLWNRDPNGTEKLLEYAQVHMYVQCTPKSEQWRQKLIVVRL